MDSEALSPSLSHLPPATKGREEGDDCSSDGFEVIPDPEVEGKGTEAEKCGLEEEGPQGKMASTCTSETSVDSSGTTTTLNSISMTEDDMEANAMMEAADLWTGAIMNTEVIQAEGKRLLGVCQQTKGMLESLITSFHQNVKNDKKYDEGEGIKEGDAIVEKAVDETEGKGVEDESSHNLDESDSDTLLTPRKSPKKKMGTGITSKNLREIIASLQRTLAQRPSPSVLLTATILGFSLAFLFFFVHTILHHQILTTQTSHYANMTATARNKEDSLREFLMHKSYEDARAVTEELKTCKKDAESLRMDFEMVKRGLKDNENVKVQELKRAISMLKEANGKLRAENAELVGKFGKAVGFIIVGVFGIALVIVGFCITKTGRFPNESKNFY